MGGHERIYYGTGGDPGHVFPGNAFAPLPRVTRHVVDPGFGQAVMETQYLYRSGSSHPVGNFLGFGALDGWPDDGRDHLYDASPSYTYGTTEEQLSQGRVQRRIERTFSRFHLLVEEVTTQGNCCKRVTTTHHADSDENRNKPFAEQPPYCQLPKTMVTRWELTDDPSRSREETVETRFDDYGNLLERIEANGTREVNTYYPAPGEGSDCPPDPEGFVRHLRSQTRYPAPATHGSAPTLRSEYRYVALPTLAGAHANTFLAEAADVMVDVGVGEVMRTETEYFDDPGDSLRLGREKSVTQTLNGHPTVTDHQYTLLDSARLGEQVLQVVDSVTGFDGTHRSTTQEHSLLNGELLLLQDEEGVEIRYRYDALARVTHETVAPGTEFEATREYSYHLLDHSSVDQAWQVMTDVKGVQTRTRFDGVSRPVGEERQDVDAADASGSDRAAAPFRQTYRALHNALGELVQEVRIDWLDARDLPLPTGYGYDSWGERSHTTRADGVTEWDVLDPVGSAQATGGIRRSWLADTAGIAGGVTESWLDAFGKPTRIERFDSAGVSVSLVRNHYDGLGRQAAQIDARDETTAYRYDAFDRVVEITVPGGHAITRVYAPHSAEDLPTEISVSGVVLGTQTFDGLDRMVEAVTGGRRRAFFYTGSDARPTRVLTPAQHEIFYEYQPLLGEEVTLRQLDGAAANYTYDPQSSDLVACMEQGVQLDREYYSTGQIRKETRRQGEHEDVAHFSYSLGGRLLSYTALGMEQAHAYDAAGRVSVARQGQSVTRVTYDRFGRVSTLSSGPIDRDAHPQSARGGTLTVTVEYDDFGRETLRRFDSGGPVRELALTYDAADAIATRVLSEGGSTVRAETFTYDQRGRLQIHRCSGTELPQDAWGKTFTRQIFVSDELDNLRQVRTSWDGGENVATYHYSQTDPVQLERISNCHPDYPQDIALDYDADGNLILDERGRDLSYDALGRLTQVCGLGAMAPRSYHFDALDLLVGSSADGSSERRFYLDEALVARADDNSRSMFLRAEGRLLAEQMHGDDSGTILLATDLGNSVLREVRQGAEHDVAYTAYGFPGHPPLWSRLGYNGELHEPDTQCQLLGSGYRSYNPALMRFHSRDSMSPFKEGGANGYGYVFNNPVNYVDPSGHAAWWAVSLMVSVAGFAGGVIVKDKAARAALFTLGTAALLLTFGLGDKALRHTRAGPVASPAPAGWQKSVKALDDSVSASQQQALDAFRARDRAHAQMAQTGGMPAGGSMSRASSVSPPGYQGSGSVSSSSGSYLSGARRGHVYAKIGPRTRPALPDAMRPAQPPPAPRTAALQKHVAFSERVMAVPAPVYRSDGPRAADRVRVVKANSLAWPD